VNNIVVTHADNVRSGSRTAKTRREHAAYTSCGFCLDGDHAECERPVRTERTVRQTWTYPAEYIVTECCCEATS
jgi:hypothetical protein